MVKRYVITSDGERENPSGDFVHWQDHYTLRAELEQVKRDRDAQLAETQRAWNERDGEKRKRIAAERLAGARVKALEWDEAIHGGWVALGAAGVYHVHVGHRNETRFYFFTNPFDHEPNEFCSEAKAKAAAQADYERRILSALAEPAGEAEPVGENSPDNIAALAPGNVWTIKPQSVTIMASLGPGVAYTFDGGTGEMTLDRFLEQYQPVASAIREGR